VDTASLKVFKRIDIHDQVFYVLSNDPIVVKVDGILDATLMALARGEASLSGSSVPGEQNLGVDALMELSAALERRDTASTLCITTTEIAVAEKPIRRITLGIANDCNMACSYCYQGADESANWMSEETAIAAVDLLATKAPDGQVSLYFYGGEPLLNWDCIKATIEYAVERLNTKERNVEFWVVTNGTLLTAERARYLVANGVNIAVSMDGPENIHDSRRVFSDGRGTHAIVMQHLRQALDIGASLTVEATVTPADIEFLPERVRYFETLGIKGIVFNPLDTLWELSQCGAFTRQDWSRLSQMYERIALQNDPAPYSIEQYIDLVSNASKRHYRCEAGRRGVFVSPDGRIFPCPGFYYPNSGEMGDVRKGIDLIEQQHIIESHVDTIPACRECWARYYCGGPCRFRALRDNGDPRAPSQSDCERIRAMIEFAIRTRLQRIGRGEPAWIRTPRHRQCD